MDKPKEAGKVENKHKYVAKWFMGERHLDRWNVILGGVEETFIKVNSGSVENGSLRNYFSICRLLFIEWRHFILNEDYFIKGYINPLKKALADIGKYKVDDVVETLNNFFDDLWALHQLAGLGIPAVKQISFKKRMDNILM